MKRNKEKDFRFRFHIVNGKYFLNISFSTHFLLLLNPCVKKVAEASGFWMFAYFLTDQRRHLENFVLNKVAA